MFADAENRNTFVHTGLQVDSMHFPAEPATKNTKPVQCYICMQYNHLAKHCKTKKQVCARCGENHRLDQCTTPTDTSKCRNGNHLASSVDYPKYKEQEKKAQNLVNRLFISFQQKVEKPEKLIASSESTTSIPTTTTDQLTTTNSTSSNDKTMTVVQSSNGDASKESQTAKKPTTLSMLRLAKIKASRSPTTMIRVCHINVTSITKHHDELLARFSQYDVISVNKTNLKSERQFALKGYNIFRNDRVGKPGEAVLLAVKQQIKCRELICKTSQENELIAVQLETKTYKSMLIALIYVPPRARLNIDVFHELYGINNDYEEKIDWILASQPLFSFISNVETHPTLGLLSGHKPLTFDISIGTEVNAASPRISLNFKRANWRKYRNTLDEKLKTWNKPGPTLPGDIDDYAEFVT
ncbi:unnamed protein product, partial [Adineta ricciae]